MPLFLSRAWVLALCLVFAGNAWAFEAFTIGDIQVHGLQRLETGTVLTYLPVTVGDRMDDQRSAQAIRALYQTGLFENVSLARNGNTLIVNVRERPEIADFSIKGNKAIGGKKLKKSLKKEGLAKGELYKRALLDQVTLELRRQYYANGFYGVQVATEVTEEKGNRVDITITVKEGQVATIKDINIVGNKDFSDEQLLQVFKLKAGKPFYKKILFWKHPDRYSREKLLGDLQSLNSFYQNRGYLRFNVTSIQVSLSPDKRDVYLTVNVHEGQAYRIKKIEFAGDLIVPESALRRLVSVRTGETFSRKLVSQTTDRISSGLADFGYAFANVDPLTKLDDKAKTVTLTFYVEPGKRAYVRRINFSGNKKTNDTTLRREMRQFEGATFSRRAVQRSRVRLARLPYIKEAKVDTKPVPGSDDLVDVNFNVEERPAGSLQFGIGFSGAQGFLINGSITQTNFRGTGNRLSLSAQTTSFEKSVSASWTDPYFTEDGVSRTVSAFYRRINSIARFSSAFDLNAYGTSVTFGIPISEYSSIRLGGAVEEHRINARTQPFFSNGRPVFLASRELRQFINENGRDFLSLELRTGWQRDTRNRTFFATSGADTQVNFDIEVPGSSIEYYKASFTHQQFLPVGSWLPLLSRKFVLKSNLRIADAVVYGKGSDVPPYDNYFAGGARSVRGFKNSFLGPVDSFDNPFGGQFLTVLRNDLVIPTPFAGDNKSYRASLFYDIGNVYSGANVFSFHDLGRSAGVSFELFTPFFGLLRVSYAPYVTGGPPGARTDRFQFSFGVGL